MHTSNYKNLHKHSLKITECQITFSYVYNYQIQYQ